MLIGMENRAVLTLSKAPATNERPELQTSKVFGAGVVTVRAARAADRLPG